MRGVLAMGLAGVFVGVVVGFLFLRFGLGGALWRVDVVKVLVAVAEECGGGR